MNSGEVQGSKVMNTWECVSITYSRWQESVVLEETRSEVDSELTSVFAGLNIFK